MKRKIQYILTIAFLFSLLPVCQASAAEIGQIEQMSNSVQILRNNNKIQGRVGELVRKEDTILTGSNSNVWITFTDNSQFSLGANSRVELSEYTYNPGKKKGNFSSTVRKGTLVVVSGKIAKFSPQAMKVRTRTSTISVRGTKFMVKVE